MPTRCSALGSTEGSPPINVGLSGGIRGARENVLVPS